MILLFESKITYTKDIIKEYHRLWFFKSKLWLVFLLPLAVIVVGILQHIANDKYQILVLGIILGIIFLFTLFLRYKNDTKLSYARLCEQNQGNEISNLVQFFDSEIILTNTLTQNKNKYSYSNIKRIRENKNLVLLITKKGLLIAVEKAKFTVGNESGLIAFIKSKIQTKSV